MIGSTDIIFTCHSTNNKNVRKNELKILRKKDNALYFEFGENEMNIKKRHYNDMKTLEKDFKELQEIKKDLEKTQFEKNDNERKSISSKKIEY